MNMVQWGMSGDVYRTTGDSPSLNGHWLYYFFKIIQIHQVHKWGTLIRRKQSENCTTLKDATSCKYLGIILHSGLSWGDQVNYTVKKAWKALHFTMWILKKGNSNTKSLAYLSLVRPILEYGGRALGSIQGGANNCVIQGAKERSQICTSYNQYKLEHFGVA